MNTNWTASAVVDQHGRTAIVTGANSGLGRIVAHELARGGAQVVIASRNTDKGMEAATWIRGDVQLPASTSPSSTWPA
jgi:NAD(P)-dependent dehydrogenase (short-subunit alcohol dehydrogenase family)